MTKQVILRQLSPEIELRRFIQDHGIKVLNVAGPGASKKAEAGPSSRRFWAKHGRRKVCMMSLLVPFHNCCAIISCGTSLSIQKLS